LAFSYQLSTIQIPNCGYATTAWTAITTSSDNSANVASYNTISATGLFAAGPFPDSSTFGSYYLTINSVTLSVNGVNTAFTSIATAPTNAFLLTVSDGCADAVITASVVVNFSLKVFDLL
jgi:hypothetical protein